MTGLFEAKAGAAAPEGVTGRGRVVDFVSISLVDQGRHARR